jgi:RNA-directed DNA polymerase
MMESEVTGNCHASFGERDRETRKSKGLKVRSVPTLFSPLLANVALNGIEDIHPCVRYADDMLIILKPKDDATSVLRKIKDALTIMGLKVSEAKTNIIAATDGFDFLGWHFLVQNNGKFRCTPSVDNVFYFP